MKGIFATVTGSIFPRKLASSRMPGAAWSIATYPIATGAFRLGPKPPEVTRPIAGASLLG